MFIYREYSTLSCFILKIILEISRSKRMTYVGGSVVIIATHDSFFTYLAFRLKIDRSRGLFPPYLDNPALQFFFFFFCRVGSDRDISIFAPLSSTGGRRSIVSLTSLKKRRSRSGGEPYRSGQHDVSAFPALVMVTP